MLNLQSSKNVLAASVNHFRPSSTRLPFPRAVDLKLEPGSVTSGNDNERSVPAAWVRFVVGDTCDGGLDFSRRCDILDLARP